MVSEHMKEISAIGEVQKLNEDAQALATQIENFCDRLTFDNDIKNLTDQSKSALRAAHKSLREKVGPW